MPTYMERMEKLLTDYKSIFGSDIYVGEDTQDYQLMSLFCKAMDDGMACILESYLSRNPNYARENALDDILPVNGINRRAASFSTAEITVRGTSGTPVPKGTQFRDTLGHVWSADSTSAVGSNGTVTVKATCTESGSISADAGTITMINSATNGLVSCTNAAPAIVGNDTETDAEVRYRRTLSVSLPSRSILDGIRAALVSIEGVKQAVVYENSSTQTDSNGIPAHSICAVVDGGIDADIAESLYFKKSPGVSTYGDENVPYVDSYGYTNPMRFYRPVVVPVAVTITLRAMANWNGQTMQAQIKEAISEFINAITIGEDLVCSTLYGVAFTVSETSIPPFSIVSLSASRQGQALTTDAVITAFNEVFSCSPENVLITMV